MLLHVRKDFPVLERKIDSRPIIYLDSAATSLKPRVVSQAMMEYLELCGANVHRGIYRLSEEATEAYENARAKVARFINARSKEEIVFTRNATESINLVAYSWGRKNIKRGGRVLLTEMEHHSNLVPWQLLAKENGAEIDFIPIDDEGNLQESTWEDFFKKETKIFSVTHASNVLGTINPLKALIRAAHEKNVLVMVDAAQSVPHMPVDVQELECDFLAFSGHKMLGPPGIGILYARRPLLESMDPFLGGGDMIREVHLREAKWNDVPWKFEAGTPNIAGTIGLGAAIDYLTKLGMRNIRDHERDLTKYALEEMYAIDFLKVYGPKDSEKRVGVISFNVDGVHPHDVATILDEEGISIRSGQHCAQPLLERLGVPATCRASFYIYNTKEEIDLLIEALKKVRKIFGY